MAALDRASSGDSYEGPSTKVHWPLPVHRNRVEDVSSSLQRVLSAPVGAELRPLIGSCLASVLRIGADLVRPWPLALAVDYALDARPLDSRLSWATPEIVLVTAGLATVLVTAVGGRLDMMATRSGERAAERIGARLRATGL